MPVTDASRKVSAVIANRQAKGEWICALPYGYVFTNTKKMLFKVDEPAAEVVRKVFQLYIDGWGYKRIANYLTDQHIPTPRSNEKAHKEARGDDYKGKVRNVWNLNSINHMLKNDFYIGTLREHKYRRKKINGQDMTLDKNDHIVFENHHEAIIDYKTFATVQELLKQRSETHYRGVKKHENTYSGFLFCGDCNSPMFSMSRSDLAPAYTCGNYHSRGLAACTSHHIRVDFLDKVLKEYLQKVKENSESMIHILEEVVSHEPKATEGGKAAEDLLREQIEVAREELKTLTRQKVRDIARQSGSAEVIEETYDALIEEVSNRIEGLNNQFEMVADTTNSIIRANRVTKTVLEVFDEILNKEKLDKTDHRLIIDRILVYEDHLEVRLKADIDELLRTGRIEHLKPGKEEETAVNFNLDTENIERVAEDFSYVTAQRVKNQRAKVFRVNVIYSGSPSFMRKVRRISLGITTLPNSSIRLTMPVAFIKIPPFTYIL
jgi:hypothetical protein